MRILVTGSRGWAGVGIVRALLAHNHQVVGLDISPVVADPARHGHLREVQGDATDPATLFAALDNCDAAVHSVASRTDEPFDSFRIYVASTLYLLEAARQRQVRQIVLLSSSAVVYHHIIGLDGSVHEYKLDARTPPNFRAFYGLVKYQQEQIGEFYAHHHGLSVIVLRPWWIVDGLRQCTRFGTPLTEDTHPLSPTGLIDRDDLGEVCHLALLRPDITYDIFYPVAGPEADRFFDVEHLRRELGWRPRYTLEDVVSAK